MTVAVTAGNVAVGQGASGTRGARGTLGRVIIAVEAGVVRTVRLAGSSGYPAESMMAVRQTTEALAVSPVWAGAEGGGTYARVRRGGRGRGSGWGCAGKLTLAQRHGYNRVSGSPDAVS